MDSKSVGRVIAQLRQQNGWTQAQLAEMLDVSGKTVSKWESGRGFPDVTLFPAVAELFGVSVDYLMLGEERGVTIAGSTLVDIVNNIDAYPHEGMLVEINDITQSVGGCMPNTAINLAKIDRRIPVSAIGKVGSDENGRYVVSTLHKHGIDVSKMCYTTEAPTGFCNVMSVPSGERTFFHKKGANALFCPEDIDVNALSCSMLHIGYVLLLDSFDAEEQPFGTAMARFLASVQKRGIKTSIDLVSDSAGNYGRRVIPVLKYCNYVIINETECCGIWEIDPRHPDGRIHEENVRLAMQKCIDAGVGDLVVVHCKECCFALTAKGKFTTVPSLCVPPEDVKGTVGAGDAFCSGALIGILKGYTPEDILLLAEAAAVASLTAADATSGITEEKALLERIQNFER